MICTIIDLLGRFHPILVHLPIGILLLGCVMQLLSALPKYAFLWPGLQIISLVGASSALLSALTGYLLAQSGEYEAEAVSTHQWLGIGVAVISACYYAALRAHTRRYVLNILSIMLLIVIPVTGHYGGILTHGSDYLSAALGKAGNSKQAIPPLTDPQNAVMYSNVVQPLLKNRCYNCHGEDKQKGKLRLDLFASMLKGGEDGEGVVPGKAEESEIIRRVELPLANEDHMPPKERPQLTNEEILLLQWWIDQGADEHKKISELTQTEEVRAALAGLSSGGQKTKSQEPEIINEEVSEGDPKAVDILRKQGVAVVPLSTTNHHLSANFIGNNISEEHLKSLITLKKQLVYLDLTNTDLDDKKSASLANLSNVVKLNLRATDISDKSMATIAKLKNLQYLNLVETAITAKGLAALKPLTKLKSIYLYKSAVDSLERVNLAKQFSKISLEFGDYNVPTFETDTTQVKEKK